MNRMAISLRTALAMSLLIFLGLLFVSPSMIALGASASVSTINCTTSVCAYAFNSNAAFVINGTKIVNTVTTHIISTLEEGWDFVTGLICEPSGGSSSGPVIMINAATNKVVKHVSSNKFDVPTGCVYDPSANVFLVANYESASVSIINATTLKASSKTISVGDLPYFLAYNPSSNQVFVANVESGSVSVLNALTLKLVKTVTVGEYPRGIAFDPANNDTYVVNTGSVSISVISSTDKVIKTISGHGFEDPYGVNYGNGNMYVTDSGANALFIISSQNKVREVTGFSEGPEIGAYDPALGWEYVIMNNSSQIWILNGTKISPVKITIQGQAWGLMTTANLP